MVIAELSDQQREAVESAVESGFFDRPSRATATEIADRLDMPRSVFLFHLQAVEEILLETTADSSNPDETVKDRI